jgi:hypothetical protein
MAVATTKAIYKKLKNSLLEFILESNLEQVSLPFQIRNQLD